MLVFVIIVVIFVFLMIKFDNPAAAPRGFRDPADVRGIEAGVRIEDLIEQGQLQLAGELHDELLDEVGYSKRSTYLANLTENVITAFAEAGRFDEAGKRLEEFARAASEFDNPDLYLSIGYCCRMMVREFALAGRLEEAGECFAKLMDLPRTVHEEEISELRISAAHWLCLCKNDLEPEADGLRRLLDIKLQLQDLGCELDAPDEFAELLEELAEYACSAGDPEAAAELYEEILLLKESPQVHAHQLRVAAKICACHAGRGEMEQARDYFEKLPPLEDGRPCAAYHDAAAAIALAKVEKGNYEGALAFHKQALAAQMLPGVDIWSSIAFNQAVLPALARASLKTGDKDGIEVLRELPLMPDENAPPRSAAVLASLAATMAECLSECVEHYIETGELDQAVPFFRRLAEMEAAAFVGEGSKAFVEGESDEDSPESMAERRQELLDGLDFDLALEKKYAAQTLYEALDAAGRGELAEELRALIDWERIAALLGPAEAEEPAQPDQREDADEAARPMKL